MNAFVDFSGNLQEAKDFHRTEEAISSKTWIKKDSNEDTWLGFSRVPSKSTLKRKKSDLAKCPHDYTLAFLGEDALALVNSMKMKWRLSFNDASERKLWIDGHLLKRKESI